MKSILLLILIIVLGCKKELNIIEFTNDFSYYEPELRIEALILPHDSTALVRIDRSFLLSDTIPYICIDNDYGDISKDSCESIEGAFWHGRIDDITAYCGDWNPFIHDIGSDGILATDNNSDGDYEDFGDVAPDEDGTENNGQLDCDEPNVDSYVDLLPNVHDQFCEVSMIKKINNVEDRCNFEFNENAGHFSNNKYTGENSNPIFDNIESINYGAYVPVPDCSKEFWINYSAEYTFLADCESSGFSIIQSKSPIKLSRPVVFFLPEDSLEIIQCTDYDCLQANSSISDYSSDSLLYFGRYSIDSYINYVSILPNITYQSVQYMYDNKNDVYVYYHGHPAVGTDMFNIVDSVSVMIEAIVSEFYDGHGNGVRDPAESRTENSNNCELDETHMFDSDGGYCDNGNGKWDDEELYADVNQNNQWDEEEYFIDSADGLPDVDTYYYEIFTFSDSYEKYYFNDQIFLDDVERTNLRDQTGKPILGAFGSMTSEKIYFQIIDCTIHGPLDCENSSITKSVCEWQSNISLVPCVDYEGPICLPKGFSTEYCE